MLTIANNDDRGDKYDKGDKGDKGGKVRGGNEGYSKVYLHTGDMRYHPKMKNYAALQNLKIDKIFLDTTYAHPKHKVNTCIRYDSLINHSNDECVTRKHYLIYVLVSAVCSPPPLPPIHSTPLAPIDQSFLSLPCSL